MVGCGRGSQRAREMRTPGAKPPALLASAPLLASGAHIVALLALEIGRHMSLFAKQRYVRHILLTSLVAAAPLYADPEVTVDLPGGAAMDFVWIEPGTFTMGSPESEEGRRDNEGPQHEVTIGHGYYLAKHEITQGQWRSVTGTTPWSGRNAAQEGATIPALYITWDDVQAMVSLLNEDARQLRYRLPTEAEWEYACRAGTTGRWSFGDDEEELWKHEW